MKGLFLSCVLLTGIAGSQPPKKNLKVFDVHVHGTTQPVAQLAALQQAGVYKVAISTSWELQESYRKSPPIDVLYGLMLPCPAGKVPYSLQPCFSDGSDWPAIDWVEQQILDGKINYLGEILSQYYGISSSDSLLFPYYRLAQQYQVPVGIHTGRAGPDHGSPNFSMEMGNPLLLEPMLRQFPSLRVWIMHSGDQYYAETIRLMKQYKTVYADISVISNPDIVSPDRFQKIMKAFMEAGLEDRLMFGTDNGDIEKVLRNTEALSGMSEKQKRKLYFQNAERFFNSD